MDIRRLKKEKPIGKAHQGTRHNLHLAMSKNAPMHCLDHDTEEKKEQSFRKAWFQAFAKGKGTKTPKENRKQKKE